MIKKNILLSVFCAFMAVPIMQAQISINKEIGNFSNVETLSDKDSWKTSQIMVSMAPDVDCIECSFVHYKLTYTYDKDGNNTRMLREKIINNDTIPSVSYDWENNYDYYYFWNDRGQEDSTYHFIYKSGRWMKEFRTEFKYDENGNLLSQTGFKGGLNDEWVYNYQYVYTYDDNNNKLSETYNYPNEKGEWQAGSKIDYAYDSKNNLVGEEHHRNDVLTEQNTYTYDNKNRVLSKILHFCNDSEYYEFHTYIYDDDKNAETEIVTRSASLSSKQDSMEWNYKRYDANNNIIEDANYYWISQDERIRGYHFIQEYDENNLMLRRYSKRNSWEKDILTEFLYDGHNLLETNRFYRNSEEDEWHICEKSYRNYDKNYNCIEAYTIYLNGLVNEWQPMNDAVIDYTYNDGKDTSYIGSIWRIEMTYLQIPTSNESVNPLKQRVKTYFSGGLLRVKFDGETPFDVTVYNMQGAMVAQRNGNHSEATIPLNGEPRGIYVVRVKAGDYKYSQKVVK